MPSLSAGPAAYERALTAAGLSEVTVFHRQTTGSTNDDAREMAASRLPLLEDAAAIFVAEAQTHGRGRGSNSWESPRGSIALTVTAPGVEVARLGVLPLGVGAVVAETLRRIGARAFVKWPNDVLIEDRKVCGILCESSLLGGTARVFIGIGINVDGGSADPEVAAEATTLAAHGVSADRPALVAELTTRVLDLLRGGDSGEAIVERWKAVAAPWWGKEVAVVESGAPKRMVLLDVNPEGHLVARDEGGAVRTFLSGEVRHLRVSRT